MALTIHNLSIDPPLALAPMVGLTHSVFRSLLVELGGVGLLYSEMLSAKRLPSENAELTPGLIRSSIEYPLFYQIWANEDTDVVAAVRKIEELNGQGIDLNLGCPAPQLRKIGAGRYLLERPDRLMPILHRIRTSTTLPLSVKIRIGPTADPPALLLTCRMLEEQGVDLIVVHARLAGEKFCRKPRWQLLDVLHQRLSIPFFANGGIFTVQDARDCLALSGADGLMIGRGAVQWPWLISAIARDIYGHKSPLAYSSPEQLYFTYIDLLIARFPPERRLGRLKQFTHYFAASLPFGHSLASTIQSSGSMEEARTRAAVFFEKPDNQSLTQEN